MSDTNRTRDKALEDQRPAGKLRRHRGGAPEQAVA